MNLQFDFEYTDHDGGRLYRCRVRTGGGIAVWCYEQTGDYYASPIYSVAIGPRGISIVDWGEPHLAGLVSDKAKQYIERMLKLRALL